MNFLPQTLDTCLLRWHGKGGVSGVGGGGSGGAGGDGGLIHSLSPNTSGLSSANFCQLYEQVQHPYFSCCGCQPLLSEVALCHSLVILQLQAKTINPSSSVTYRWELLRLCTAKKANGPLFFSSHSLSFPLSLCLLPGFHPCSDWRHH